VFDVISFGSAIVDLLLKSPAFKIKETAGRRFICQPYGEKVEAKEMVISSGGAGTNAAVSFARLGLRSAVVARLGRDFFGRLIVNELESEGVTTDLLAQKDEETDVSVILIGPDGDRTVLVYRGPTRLEEEDFDWGRLDSQWFYLSSLEGNLDLAEKLIVFSQRKAIRVAWNPGRRELEERGRVLNLAGQVEVFNLNRKEMEELVGLKFEDQGFWSKVAEIGAKVVLVTDGRNGAYLFQRKKPLFKPAPKVEPVDETGAGDAFGSGFVAGLINNLSLDQSFELAMRNAASVVQQIGAKKGLGR